MKKVFCLCVIVFIIIFLATSFYRGINLSKQFDRLALTDFNAIGITVNDVENIHKKGTEKYELFCVLLSDICQLISPGTSLLQRGEAKEGADVTLYNNEEILYKLYLGYAPHRNIMRMQIVNENNFSITRHYYVEAEIIQKFFDSEEITNEQKE